ncbi:hypothetical protein C5F59_010250 [Streptomyces sp. QL37]|uniref:hypothetical protein n=1 Tax=Streptomyces sp. QL37 TaxID=2093747 RepID=UPI000CF263FB|nr:hypothetical protein [Streptomyces sp. QL37]PPQ60178.1 hypothetical protein C5F59_28510 [Streptomyces sp. QL37]
MSDSSTQPRLSVLRIDGSTELPLLYVYLPDEQTFRTMGYVRLPHITLPGGVTLPGPDTAEARDAFLREVLTALLVPPRRARSIVRAASHVGAGGPGVPVPLPDAEGSGGNDGSHLLGTGMLVGLLAGSLAGSWFAGWNGAVIGAFLGAATFGDLFMAGWQLAHVRSPDNAVEVHDTLALLMITVGVVGGGVAGCLLGDGGFAQARGLFLGMSLAAFVLSLVAAGFSMVPFRQRVVVWLGPPAVGGCCWALYTLWNSPAALVIGVVAGTVIAATGTRGITGR